MSSFPPIEDFDGELVSGGSADAPDFANDDFLAREKAVLGDDAEAFQGGDSEEAAFETSFPPVETNLNRSGVIAEPAAPYLPGQPTAGGLESETKKLSLDDSEPIKEWKARRELEIQRRDEVSDAKKKETQEKAHKAIDDFYENYNTKKDASLSQSKREAEQFVEDRDNAVAGGTTWDRIVKLIDTSDSHATAKGRDKSRFKEILVSLKGDVDAPGAGGY